MAFSWTPPTGLNDTSGFPRFDTGFRARVQALLDQARDAINLKADKTQENWIAPTLLNGWVNYGLSTANLRYFKDTLGIVHLSGIIKSGTNTGGTVICNLPAGYRPLTDHSFRVVNTLNSGGRIEITAAGNVTVQESITTEFLSIEATFKAEQ